MANIADILSNVGHVDAIDLRNYLSNLTKSLQVNLLKDAGRFSSGNVRSRTVGVFAPNSDLFESLNGSVSSLGGTFNHNIGGSNADVNSLLVAMGRASSIHGVEFNIEKRTVGIGTLGGYGDGVHYLTSSCVNPWYGGGDKLTCMFWIKVTIGSLKIRKKERLLKNGVSQAVDVTIIPQDSWVHILSIMNSAGLGYAYSTPYIYGSNNTVFELALPTLMPWDVEVDPHKFPVMPLI